MSSLRTRCHAGTVSPEIHANESLVEFNKHRYIDLWLAKNQSRAGNRIQHPCRDEMDHARAGFDVNKLTVCALDAVKPPKMPAEKWMPAILDPDIRPDMGRMNANLL
jgi:hypothetical protein